MTDRSPMDLTGFNPFNPSVQQCPHLYYRAMQEQTPVFRVEGTDLYMVTRHESITPILRDTQTFSSRFGSAGAMPTGEVVDRLRAIVAKGWPQVPTMLTIDPPQQTRYRGTVASFFTPRRMAELRTPVTEIVNRLIDALPADGVCDFVKTFAEPLPIEAIAHVLNVPSDRMADFKRWSDDSIANIGSVITAERQLEAAEGIVEFQHYFAAQIEQRRAQGEPSEGTSRDLISELVHARIETEPDSNAADTDADPDADPDADGVHRRHLTVAESLSILQQLLVAGNETTTKALTEGMMLLAQHPDEWARLQADPAGRAPAVTEEVLRLSTPTQGMFRLVTADTKIDGVPIPAGARIIVVYAAANRDPSVWGQDADSFNPDRANMKDHLAFGKGVHFCLGAPLSRVEMQVAFELLATRLRGVSLPDTNDFVYHPSFVLRGLKKLDVHVHTSQAAPG